MIELIPAIDLIEGRCVRLSQGNYSLQKTYDCDPVEMVRRYADCGIGRVHVVDLDGAKVSQPKNLDVLERMAGLGLVDIEWGGGLKSETAVSQIFNCGATYAIVGSVAAKQPECFAAWLEQFGPARMILGADVREGKVSVNGWLEDLDLTIDRLIQKFQNKGLNQVICTDITRDGMLQGPSFSLYTKLQATYPEIDFTISGGIASMEDIKRLNDLKLRKVIIGKAIYEGHITLKDLQQFVANPVV